jgi:hypothetical protein
MARLISLADYRRNKSAKRVYFSREELSRLVQLYSLHVSRGEWRDYAIDHEKGMALFSVYRATAEKPLYSIAKFDTGGRPEFVAFEGPRTLAKSTRLEEIIELFLHRPHLVRK